MKRLLALFAATLLVSTVVGAANNLKMVETWATTYGSTSKPNAYVLVNGTAQEPVGLCSPKSLGQTGASDWKMGLLSWGCTNKSIASAYLGGKPDLYSSVLISKVGSTSVTDKDYEYAYYYLRDQCLAADGQGLSWQKFTCDGRVVCSDKLCSANCAKADDFPSLTVDPNNRTMKYPALSIDLTDRAVKYQICGREFYQNANSSPHLVAGGFMTVFAGLLSLLLLL